MDFFSLSGADIARKEKGSLTLEAALSFPVFLFLMTAVLSFFNIMNFEIRLQRAMTEAGKKLSVYSAEMTPVLIGTLVRDELREDQISFGAVEDGEDGLSFFGSLYDPVNHDVVIRVNYGMKIPFASFFNIRFPISQTLRCHAWVGEEQEDGSGEAVVFVTENGEVYHTSISCTYLDLSIREVGFSGVENRRNDSGGKYYPCEKCGEGSGKVVFITKYGNRYHFSGNCSGLKRSIMSVPVSEIGALPMCSRCRKREGK